jgi:hypothetical protein
MIGKANLTPGNPTGAHSKAKISRMEAMADFGETVKKKVEDAIVLALNDSDSKTYMRACELILKYTCPIPKDTSDDSKEANPLNQILLEKLSELQEENRRLKASQ